MLNRCYPIPVLARGRRRVLDTSTKSCPDFYGMMRYVDIHWNKVPGGKKWFVSKRIPVFIEIGSISDRFYADHYFHIDKDKVNKKYIFNSDKDHLCGTKFLCRSHIISDKKLTVKNNMTSMEMKQLSTVSLAEYIIPYNIQYELNFLPVFNITNVSVITDKVFLDTTLDQMPKSTVSLLSEFIPIRLNRDINTRVVIASTYSTPADIRLQKLDRKNDPLMIEYAHIVRPVLTIGV